MKITRRIAVGMPLLLVCGCVHPESTGETPVSADRAGSALREYRDTVGAFGDPPVRRADAAADGRTPAGAGATGDERDLYGRALALSLLELAASEHAARRAPSQEVRALAGTLARNRIELNRRISAVSGLGWSGADVRADPALNALSNETGRSYELDYLRLMSAHRMEAIALFERTQLHASGDATRDVALFALAMLRAEAAMIEEALRARR